MNFNQLTPNDSILCPPTKITVPLQEKHIRTYTHKFLLRKISRRQLELSNGLSARSRGCNRRRLNHIHTCAES
ncbi:hypothetical protein BDV40DRAFT_67246 [Aspergillus tamarii]|uniref:Uncharacterized protein n=1 Tax=Aspergillus tamarii TaxID=41984 RepID=A0A5N6UE81_ASPTM|nr:hypothetical protein BDV40DRAFT_67246 [Aspergillus tamarii]